MTHIGVIGGGIIGCSVAWALARRGARVDVFDPRPLGSGATHASAGVLAPYIEGRDSGTLFDLTVRSLDLYDDFIAGLASDTGVAVEYRRIGTLEIATEEDAAAAQRARFADRREGPLEWISAGRLRSIESAVTTGALGAILAPSHGYVVVPMLAEALEHAASAAGARAHVGAGVAAVDAGPNHVHVTFEDGNAAEFEHVVVCAGSWTPRVGLDESAARAVRPVRGQLVRLRWPADPLAHVLWGPDCYIVPWLDGTLLVGATMEEVGYDERTTAAGVRDLIDAACDLLPDAWSATFVDARAGLRPATTDNLPIVGPSSASERVVYATGHFRNGVLLAPLTSQLVTDFVLDRRRDPALVALSPARF